VAQLKWFQMGKKTARPRLDHWELATLRRLLDEEYRSRRAQVEGDDERPGGVDVGEQKEHLRRLGRLRRRLGKLVRSLKEG
jgi:hypothetical protein